MSNGIETKKLIQPFVMDEEKYRGQPVDVAVAMVLHDFIAHLNDQLAKIGDGDAGS